MGRRPARSAGKVAIRLVANQPGTHHRAGAVWKGLMGKLLCYHYEVRPEERILR